MALKEIKQVNCDLCDKVVNITGDQRITDNFVILPVECKYVDRLWTDKYICKKCAQFIKEYLDRK